MEISYDKSNLAKGQVDFLKDVLCQDSWPGCTDPEGSKCTIVDSKECRVLPASERYCGIPTESWVTKIAITLGADAREIPVMIMEIHGDKGDKKRMRQSSK